MITFNGIEYDNRHGGPFDRGSADSWYDRGIRPHYYIGATGQSTLVEGKDMTPAELTAYMAGYEHNEQFGGKKEYT